MKRRNLVFSVLVLAFVLVGLLSAGICASPQTKSLIINPNKTDLEARLWADKPETRPSYHVMEEVQLYFEVTENAFVTIFDVDSGGKITRLFPNQHQPNDFARRNRIYRVPDGYELLAGPPTGEETLLLVATRNAAVDYPELLRETSVERLISRLRRRLALSGEEWAMDVFTLRILPEQTRQIRVDVNSTLSSVSLYVDGAYAGTLPQRLNLAPGEHQLVALKSGYKVAVRDIFVDQYSTNTSWTVRMEPLKGTSEGHIRFDFDIKL
ncbi:MAG: DUF4384 domain-containing protein [Firmicutes bacterium]|nr:DUF4384 domain-containing protein [Bacillota bacterium]